MEQKDIFASLKNMQFLDRDLIKPNGYNPNHVMKQNMEYLKQSILANGFCFPIVIRPDYTIIDGYHRWLVSGEEPLRNMIAQGKAEGRKDKGFKNAVNAWGKIERYDNMQLDLYKNILIMLDGGDAKMRTYRAFLFGIHQSLVKKHKDGK